MAIVLVGCTESKPSSSLTAPSASSAIAPPPVIPTINCFSEETPIETPTGSVAIAELEVGDWVLSYDHESGRIEPRRVLHKMENPEPALLEVALANGQTLHVTAEHPLYDAASGEYRPVGELGPEVQLLRLDGEGSSLAPVELHAVELARGVEGRRAYDLTVEGNHNYFAAGVLAHNKPPPDYPLCFSEETPIETPTGSVAIAELEVGDWVQSYDHESGRIEPRRVLRKMENPEPALLEVALANGQVLNVTAEHPLYDAASEEYRPVGELGPEVRLLHLDAGGTSLAPVEIQAVGMATAAQGRRAYDLTIEDNHNYFAAGVLAHNKGVPYPPSLDPTAVPPPTCDRGPIEVATCFAQGEWDATQMPLVGAAPVRAAATPFDETASTLMAKLGARLPGGDAGVPICGAVVPSPAPVDAGASSVDGGTLPFDGGASMSDAGTPNPDAGPSLPGTGGSVSEAGVVTLPATFSPLDPAVPTESPFADAGLPADAGPRGDAGGTGGASPLPRDAGTVAAPLDPGCTHALWLEFGRCLHVSTITPYAASITLSGAPGQYRLVLIAGTGVACAGAAPIGEWTLHVEDSPVVEWLTLPESGAPYEIVAIGDGPFEVEIALF